MDIHDISQTPHRQKHHHHLSKTLKRLATVVGGVSLLMLTLSTDANQQKNMKWVGCGVSKAAFMKNLVAAYEHKSGVNIELEGGGATRGIRDIASGKSHLGGSCRLPLVMRNKDGSYSVDAAERSVKMIPLGWDAIVVIVHPSNTLVSNLSEEQLRDIYTGKITNWREVGGDSDAPINLYARDGKISGVERTMRQLIFDNPDQEFTSRATLLPSTGKIEQAIEKDPYGIGVSGISSSRTRQVKMLSLNGVAPNLENIRNGSYKYDRLLFLVVPANYKEDMPDVRDFVKYATSLEGQKIIERSGTLSYLGGLRLLRVGLSNSYVHTLEVVEQAGIYKPGGEN